MKRARRSLSRQEMERVLDEHKGICYALALKVSKQPRARQFTTIEDLYQEAVLCLFDALATFQVGRAKFSTFAWHWVRGGLKSYLKEQGIIRVPHWVQDGYANAERYRGCADLVLRIRQPPRKRGREIVDWAGAA